MKNLEVKIKGLKSLLLKGYDMEEKDILLLIDILKSLEEMEKKKTTN